MYSYSGRRVTLDDIATASGTSIATVSRALQGSPRVASATRERIERVAEELGYRANVAASLLSSARPQILGLICSLDRELHVRYHSGILREAQRKDFRVVVESVDDPRDVDRAWESLLQVRTQSVIVADSSLISQRYSTVPTVLIDQQAPRDDIDLITSAHESGMHEAMTLLRGRGRRRLAFIEGPPGPAARARQTAFIDACRSTELDYVTLPGGDDVDAGFLAVRVGLPAGVDVLVCYNDQCAHGAILALVIGCDNSALASSRALALTSIDPSPSRLAALAVELAITRAKGRNVPPVRRSVDTELVVRASTG